MSTFSLIGSGIVGAVVAVAGIVTIETNPEPPSAIVVCEGYSPAAAVAVGTMQGCCLDGRTVRVIVASSSDLQTVP